MCIEECKAHKPAVTVLMPVYNGARYLREALDSILAQSFTDFELLVIDDGSTDGSPELVASCEDARIRLVRRERNMGLIATLNQGLELARADLVARMDADDVACPHRLERQVAEFRERPGLVLLGSDLEIIDAAGVPIGYEPKPVDDVGLKLALSVICAIGHPTVVFRREAVLKVGGYREEFHAAEDYDLWTRLAVEGEFRNLPVPLLKYRINPQGESLRKTALQSENSAIIRRREWLRYGAAGPAPRESWHFIWPRKSSVQKGRDEIRFYADLHRHFARAYAERGQGMAALGHHLAAIYWQCNSVVDAMAILRTIRDSFGKLR
ncbi:glycosyltransferase [Geomonas oryzae]|uniref:glycosyltransferase n=1 Tax=Geomonas oryzae TaxID=2364273 RepID=UPI00100B904E|nr:glycosyltransferase [Geomonas oryzae]